jgi:hypothetical protein
MAQRVGRLQQENSKLRDEIKRLKGALKDIHLDSSEELPLKAFQEKSPISKDRKKELREEIDTRLNYMMPTKELLKQPKVLKDLNEEDMVASFGHEDEKHLEMPKQVNLSKNSETFENTEKNNKVEYFEALHSPRSIGTLEDESIKIQNSLDRSEDSPDFSEKTKKDVKVEPQILKDSFSSFYNDESLNKTLQDKSFNESLAQQAANFTQPFENPYRSELKPPKKMPESILKSSTSLKTMQSSETYSEKSLLSEIEALRQENMKLRLQLTKNSHASLVSLPRSRSKAKARSKSKGKSLSKSPTRKCKSRSITPRDLSTRRLKRNASNNTLVGESDLTPRRSRHCKTCDHLLSKGYSTKYCGKHGNAKLN